MSSRPVVLRALANADIDEAVAWYLAQDASQAALSFVTAVQQAFGHIGRHPGTGSSRHAYELDLPGLRSWRLKRHPYIVFYVETADAVDAWRVLHEARDIPAWMVAPDAPAA